MRKLVVSLFIIHCSLFTSQAAVRHLRPVEVAEGEAVVISAENALEARTGNPAFATATLRGGEVSVLGVSLGETQVLLSDARGVFAAAKVQVRPPYWSVLKRLFEDDPEIAIEVIGGKIVLSGSTASAETLKRASSANELDPDRIVSHVDFSPEALQVVVQDFISRAGISNVTVQVVGREVCLRGKVYDMASAKSLGERVQRFLADFPQVTVNWDGLQMFRQKILIGIEFLRWDDNRARELGIRPPQNVKLKGSFNYNWKNDRTYSGTYEDGLTRGSENSHDYSHNKVTGGSTPKDETSITDHINNKFNGSLIDNRKNGNNTGFNLSSGVKVDDVEVTLNMAKNNDVARQVYATQLATQSGEEVKFQNGGTLYMRVQGGVGATGDLRQFEWGYVINARPVIIDTDTLNLDFDLDYSRLNSETQLATGDYEVNRYKTKSKYTVRPGEVIVLSGFDSVVEQSGRTGWPILSRIPILNWFFGNRADNTKKVESLLVVTVDWAVEDTEGAKRRVKEIKDRKVEAEMP